MTTAPSDNTAKFLKFNGKVVTLVVDTSQERFTVHLAHLSRTSRFFRAAFEREWKEGQEAVITLEEDDSEVVDAYLHFTYTGKLDFRRSLEAQARCPSVDDAEYEFLAKLYCFGEKYQDSHRSPLA